uniref:Ig-like domain-containing protein n=1 Tax=Oncorhynchus mykiss TaxID=8022 RepID=A0A8K9WUM6_ONCMY
SSKVLQVPSALLESPNVTVIIKCSHTLSSYYTILWYQQSIADTNLKLIGVVFYKNPTIEDQFKQHFEIRGDGEIEASLQFLSDPENSAVYYCAASQHSDVDTLLFPTKTLRSYIP